MLVLPFLYSLAHERNYRYFYRKVIATKKLPQLLWIYIVLFLIPVIPYHYRRKFKFLQFQEAGDSVSYQRKKWALSGTKLDFYPHEGSVEALHTALDFMTGFSVQFHDCFFLESCDY